ncbi:MAG: hypothetical protein KGJ89_01075 [Patescibacteria group bacterium]|nr:hypothetical protein [Patescibacteria group bacterium]MDE2015105.1 hypothetical protein [Patescibacteria group bacterium]MDE2226533.1 hypothetical protein [Patescibacteria group bacterium]
MIVDRNGGINSNTEFILRKEGCRLTFSVCPDEPLRATLRYHEEGCSNCFRSYNLDAVELRRLIRVLDNQSPEERFTDIRFISSGREVTFDIHYKGVTELGIKQFTDFERRVFVVVVGEVLKCEKITAKYVIHQRG